MIPLESLALEHHCDDDGEYGEGDDLLDNLQLHDIEWHSVAVEAEPVGRDLGAILEEGHSPGQQDDHNQGPACRYLHFLELQMPVPGECHKNVGRDQQQYSKQSFHFSVIFPGRKDTRKFVNVDVVS